MTDDEIREIMLAHGFTVKDDSNDLKPYVYAAARALIAAINQTWLQAARGWQADVARKQAELDRLRRDGTLPKEPPPGLLMSMAIRYDHALGCPGFYDQDMYGGEGSHTKRLRSTLSTMRQLYEEVSGYGFYHPDRAGMYVNMERGKGSPDQT